MFTHTFGIVGCKCDFPVVGTAWMGEVHVCILPPPSSSSSSSFRVSHPACSKPIQTVLKREGEEMNQLNLTFMEIVLWAKEAKKWVAEFSPMNGYTQWGKYHDSYRKKRMGTGKMLLCGGVMHQQTSESMRCARKREVS